MRGFVYHGILEVSELQALREKLGLSTQLSWDLTHFCFSQELRQAGTAFNPRCELRWRLCGENHYEVLLFACEEIQEIPLQPVKGPWEVEEREGAQLINLREARFSPQFLVYPGVNASEAKLRYRLFSRNGVVAFVSPMEVR